jgi:hypothetical protein
VRGGLGRKRPIELFEPADKVFQFVSDALLHGFGVDDWR